MSLPTDTPPGIADALGYLQHHLQELTERQNTSEHAINTTLAALTTQLQQVTQLMTSSAPTERGKRDVYCDKQIGKAVTALNCMLKGSWGEVGSGGIRKKLKSEYAAYLESKYRRNDRSSI